MVYGLLVTHEHQHLSSGQVRAVLTTPLVCQAVHLDYSSVSTVSGVSLAFFDEVVNNLQANEFRVTYRRDRSVPLWLNHPVNPGGVDNFLVSLRNKHATQLALGSVDRENPWPPDTLETLLTTLPTRFPRLKRVVLADSFEGYLGKLVKEFSHVTFVYQPLGLLSCNVEWKRQADENKNVFVEPAQVL